jgi:hypothetical protein
MSISAIPFSDTNTSLEGGGTKTAFDFLLPFAFQFSDLTTECCLMGLLLLTATHTVPALPVLG